MLWWATFADGGAVAYYLPEASSPLEGSVVVIDSEGQLQPRGRSVSDFIVNKLGVTGAKHWFAKHDLAIPDGVPQAQPLPKL